MTQRPITETNLIIVQPTPFCNIDCSYCYLADRSNRKRMSLDTVKAIVKFIADVAFIPNAVTVCWHAGEPLTMPIAFYDKAFEIFAAGSKCVRQNIQTNGTLINDDWCRLFKQWDVKIGVSLDGPQAIHDAHRFDRARRGIFDRVRSGILKLQEHEIEFSVIAVLTRDSIGSADELWEFYKSAGIRRVGFNIDEKEGVNRQSTLSNSRHLGDLRRFMRRIAELQAIDPSIECRELANMRRYLTSPDGTKVAKSDNIPGAILNFDVHGNFTTFSPELLGQTHPRYGTFAWGNVHTNIWSDLARNPSFQRAWEDIDLGVSMCRNACDYFPICGGGCPSNKLAEHGTFAAKETQSCRLHVQAVADVMIERLEAEIATKTNGR